MKRKFVKVMFFGALALSTVTYVGCKDYDDDVKGLQEQIDNINQKGADVTTEAMNAAINSAIAKVQADLDKIASKADKSALDALQAVVTKLQDVVNGKADASTLESLKAELNAAIAKVNNSIAPQIEAAKEQLQQKINGLESKLETADDDIRNSIVKQIADLKTELLELMDAKAEEYAELYATKDGLKTLSEKVETLEKIKHLTTADVLTFIQTDADVKEFVDDEFVALLQDNLENPESALLAYLNGTFTTSIMTQVETKCNSIVTTEMGALRKEWAAYKKEQGESYKELEGKITKLEGYKVSAMQTLYEQMTEPANNTLAKANQCATALGNITNLVTEFGKYTTTADLEANYVKSADLDTKIGNYVDGKISALDGRVSTLEKNLEALQNGLVSMLKSLVFAPQYYDASGELIRSVSFTSVYTAKTASAEAIAISAPTDVTVNFRVSPASAVADLIGKHPKYTIVANKHVVTSRAASDNDGILTVKGDVVQAKDAEGNDIDGVITVTLDATKVTKSYALSLSVKGNNEAEKPITNFTEITSDYFAAIVAKRYINAVDYAAKDYDNPELLIDKSGSSIKFYDQANDKDNIKIKLSDEEDGSNPDAEYTLLSKLGLSTSLFKVEFTKAGTEPDYFVLGNDYALTVNQEKLPASDRYNKTCTVTPKITVTTTAVKDGKPVTAEYTGTVVTSKIVAEGVDLPYTVADQPWRDADQTVSLPSADIATILAKINEVSGQTYNNLQTAVAGATKVATADGGVTIASTSGDVTITIPAKTVSEIVDGKVKAFAPTLKLTYTNSAIVNITVKVIVAAPDVTKLALTENTVNWDGHSVVELMPSADADAMTSLTVSRKLSEVLKASEIDAINTAVTNKLVQLKVEDGEGTDVSATVTYPNFEVKQLVASAK